MWVWLKGWRSTRTQPSTIEQAFLSQQKLLESITKKQQATIDALIASQDRVLAATYERPVERTVQTVPDNQMDMFALHDQLDVRPDPIARGIENLHAESDQAFLESVN
jgi:hypothetical protein